MGKVVGYLHRFHCGGIGHHQARSPWACYPLKAWAMILFSSGARLMQRQDAALTHSCFLRSTIARKSSFNTSGDCAGRSSRSGTSRRPRSGATHQVSNSWRVRLSGPSEAAFKACRALTCLTGLQASASWHSSTLPWSTTISFKFKFIH